MSNGEKCQCILGRFTIVSGVVTSALGIAVAVGSLGFLADENLANASSFSVLLIANSLSLCGFCSMLLVAFSCPNERYAFLFGFLQFAFGKAALMSFSGILQCAAGVLFTLPGLKKEWVGVLIFISAGMQYVAMILVIARSCCYGNNPEIIKGQVARAAVKHQMGSAGGGSSKSRSSTNSSRNSGAEFGNNTGSANPSYEAPAPTGSAAAANDPNQISEDAFGSDNPFGAPKTCDAVC